MKIINREMKVTEAITDNSNNYSYCQASLNSDGNITLRNYYIRDKASDEIIILSAKETKAIFNLMRVINGETSLPF